MTRVIYYYALVAKGGVQCPYYSENGKLCRWVDGKVIEIEDTKTSAPGAKSQDDASANTNAA